MKKGVFIALALFSASLFAESEISTGGFYSLKDSNDTKYAPTTAYIKALTDYDINKSFSVYGDGTFFKGFPEGDAMAESNNFEENSYSYGGIRAGGLYKNSFLRSGVILSFFGFSNDKKLNLPVSSGDLYGFRTKSLSGEVFADAKMPFWPKIETQLGYGFYSQTLKGDLEYTGTEGEKDIKYSRLTAEIRYRIKNLFLPYASLSMLSGGENSKSAYDYKTIQAGLKGDYRIEKDLHLFYNVYAKNVSGDKDIITENKRGGLYLRGRYFLRETTELFAWFNHEYSLDKDSKLHYVDRTISFMAREWIMANKFSIAGGSTIQILKGDKENKLTDSDSLYFPVWPFVETQFQHNSILAKARYIHKFGKAYKYSDSTVRSFVPTQQRFEFDAGWISEYIYPHAGFYYVNNLNSQANQSYKDSSA